MEEIIKELAQKYNAKEKVIEILFNISIEDGYNVEQTKEAIEYFYEKKRV